jgi:hypothetical protein
VENVTPVTRDAEEEEDDDERGGYGEGAMGSPGGYSPGGYSSGSYGGYGGGLGHSVGVVAGSPSSQTLPYPPPPNSPSPCSPTAREALLSDPAFSGHLSLRRPTGGSPTSGGPHQVTMNSDASGHSIIFFLLKNTRTETTCCTLYK